MLEARLAGKLGKKGTPPARKPGEKGGKSDKAQKGAQGERAGKLGAKNTPIENGATPHKRSNSAAQQSSGSEKRESELRAEEKKDEISAEEHRRRIEESMNYDLYFVEEEAPAKKVSLENSQRRATSSEPKGTKKREQQPIPEPPAPSENEVRLMEAEREQRERKKQNQEIQRKIDSIRRKQEQELKKKSENGSAAQRRPPPQELIWCARCKKEHSKDLHKAPLTSNLAARGGGAPSNSTVLVTKDLESGYNRPTVKKLKDPEGKQAHLSRLEQNRRRAKETEKEAARYARVARPSLIG